MDDFLDRVWQSIETILNHAVALLDAALSPLEILGPGFVIFVLAFAIMGLTQIISHVYTTKRWKDIREEALKHPDRDKGKTLAKNIDQAQLNKAYYDYFFEGLLKNFITTVLPILLMVAYVTTVYTPQTLVARFGRKWVFSLGTTFPLNVSSLLWFIVCLIFSFVLFAVLKKVFKKPHVKKKSV